MHASNQTIKTQRATGNNATCDVQHAPATSSMQQSTPNATNLLDMMRVGERMQLHILK